MVKKKMSCIGIVFLCFFSTAQAAFDLNTWRTQAQATAGNVVADNTGWTFDGTAATNFNYGNLDADSNPGTVDQGASIEYIFNLSDNGASPILGSLDGVTSKKTTLKLEQWSNQAVFGITSEGVIDAIFSGAPSVFSAGVHVVFVNRTDGNFEIFVNGVSQGIDNRGGGWVTNGGLGKLGGDSTGWGVPNGTIYAVGSYNRALNSTEVAALYNAAHLQEFTGRIAYHSYSSYSAMDSVISICDLQSQVPFSINKIAQNTINPMNVSFSPDGSMLTFMADPLGSSSAWWNMEVYLYDFTTDSLVQLTNNAFPSEDPKFSSDGSKIIYKRYNSSSGYSTIYTCDLDGTNLTALTPNVSISHDESGPRYSPDGSKIAYWRTWNNGSKQERIWWMNSDGSSAQQLVPDSNVRIMYYPAYLDSERLAYTRWLTNQSGLDQLHIYNITTSADTPVAFKDESANDSDAFSLQDPNWMGFSSTRASGSGGYDLYFGNLQTGEFDNLSYANTSLEDLGGHYTPVVNPPSTRTVTVDSTPQGAGFTISGVGTNNSFTYAGTTPWTNNQMLPGNYTVQWDPLPTYITPAPQTKYLTSANVSFFGTYTTGAGGDVVTIIKAEYKVSKSELKVEATSDGSPTAVLTVVDYGTMTYDSNKDKYKFRDKPVADPGGTVTVTSDLGGSDTATVTYK